MVPLGRWLSAVIRMYGFHLWCLMWESVVMKFNIDCNDNRDLCFCISSAKLLLGYFCKSCLCDSSNDCINRMPSRDKYCSLRFSRFLHVKAGDTGLTKHPHCDHRPSARTLWMFNPTCRAQSFLQWS